MHKVAVDLMIAIGKVPKHKYLELEREKVMVKTISTSQKVVYTGLFLALGLVLPQMFHFLPIANAGKIMLPMHIPAILAGYLLGKQPGMIVGFLSPVLSCLMLQMPAPLFMPIMAVELLVYGLVAGTLGTKIKNNYLSLIAVMIAGRIASGAMYIIMANVFGLHQFNLEMFTVGLATGVPGIILQLVIIPPMIKLLRKANR